MKLNLTSGGPRGWINFFHDRRTIGSVKSVIVFAIRNSPSLVHTQFVSEIERVFLHELYFTGLTCLRKAPQLPLKNLFTGVSQLDDSIVIDDSCAFSKNLITQIYFIFQLELTLLHVKVVNDKSRATSPTCRQNHLFALINAWKELKSLSEVSRWPGTLFHYRIA